MSAEAKKNADVVSRALALVVGGGDLSTDELVDTRDDALSALDDLVAEVVWLGEKLDNITAEIRRTF